MKPIITLIALLACLASLAQALNHGGIRRLITEDIAQSTWYSGDTKTGSCIDAELLDGQSASELIASWKTNSRYVPGFIRAKITSAPFTNVVSGDNHTGCSTCDGIARNNWLIYHPQHDGGLPYVPATERWTIITVGVRHTATIPGWPGELVKEDISSCVTNREVLKTDWVNVGPAKVQSTNEGGGGGGGGFGDGTITNVISKSITNTFYYEPIISDGTPPKFIKPLYSNAPTNGPDPTIWQYDSNRKWNKDIEELKRDTEAESKRIREKTGESIVFVRGDGRVPFDFKTDAKDIELGYKQDGTVTWRKTPERTKQ